MPKLTVVYDACVLYPAPLRDLLMWLALTDLFRARWTDQIHDEWIRNLLANRPDLNPEQLERTRDLMNSNIRDCLVSGYEYLIDGLELPDPDDRHVLAAAIQAEASVILTFNLKDFPTDDLSQYEVEAQHPDEFIIGQLDQNRGVVSSAVREQRASLKNPTKSVDEFLDVLAKQDLPQTVERLREHADLI